MESQIDLLQLVNLLSEENRALRLELLIKNQVIAQVAAGEGEEE